MARISISQIQRCSRWLLPKNKAKPCFILFPEITLLEILAKTQNAKIQQTKKSF